MIIKICNDVVNITEDEIVNTKNYVESLPYMKNLHIFISVLKDSIPLNKIKFEPTFKGPKTITSLGLADVHDKEKQMLLFRISSDLFLEDKKLVDKIKKNLNKLSETIIYNNGSITFNLDKNKMENYKR